MYRDSIEDASCHRLAIHANPTQSRTLYLILHIIDDSDAAKFQEPLNSTRDILHMHFKNSGLSQSKNFPPSILGLIRLERITALQHI